MTYCCSWTLSNSPVAFNDAVSFTTTRLDELPTTLMLRLTSSGNCFGGSSGAVVAGSTYRVTVPWYTGVSSTSVGYFTSLGTTTELHTKDPTTSSTPTTARAKRPPTAPLVHQRSPLRESAR